jgi:hypothetical protein
MTARAMAVAPTMLHGVSTKNLKSPPDEDFGGSQIQSRQR